MISPGDLLQARYRVIGLLGQGGMGAVYEALDERLGNQIALKQCSFDRPEVLRQFEREARLLAGMRHSSLTRVIDHFVENGAAFLVMEYIPGKDLGGMLNDGERFGVDRVLEWTDQLLAALEYLHSRQPPVIHRDIKPQNLKITARDEIILLDFGLAKGYAGQSSPSDVSRSVYGYTPNYAPLEQIQGTEGTDNRSDLYSLAATVYHLLTANQPPGVLVRLGKISEGRPDPLESPAQVNQLVPMAVADVLVRAMSIGRDSRYGDAAEMRVALREARASQSPTLSGAPTTIPATTIPSGSTMSSVTPPARAARPPVPGLPAGNRSRSKWSVLLLMGCVALLLLLSAGVATLYWIWSGSKEDLKQTEPLPPAENPPPASVDGRIEGGITSLPGHTASVRSVAWSPDGSMLASGSWDSSARVWQITGVPSPKLLATIPRTRSTINAVAFSPDSRMVAVGGYDSSGSTVTFHDPRSGSEVRSPLSVPGLVGSVLFSPDGRRLYTTMSSSVGVWDLATGEQVLLIRGSANPSIALSPDGTMLALTTTNEDVVQIFDTSSGKLLREFSDLTNGALSVSFSSDGHNVAAGLGDSYVRVWSLLTGELVRGIPLQNLDMPFSVDFHPVLPLLASGTYRHVRIWNAASGVPLKEVETGEASIIYSLRFSPDGRTLAAATGNGRVLLIPAEVEGSF